MRLKNLLSRCLSGVGLAGTIALLAAAPANASYTICNKTDKTVSYSFVVQESSCQLCNGNVCAGGTYPQRQQGWWVMSPGQCKVVFGGDARRLFVWYAFSSDGAYVWTSSRNVWATPKAAHNQCRTDALVSSSTHIVSGHLSFTPTSSNFTSNLVHN